MIIIFEQDLRRRPGMGFWKSFFSSLRPMFESSIFHGRKSYRVGWINWSVSFYQSESLRGFMDHIASGCVGWRGGYEWHLKECLAVRKDGLLCFPEKEGQ